MHMNYAVLYYADVMPHMFRYAYMALCTGLVSLMCGQVDPPALEKETLRSLFSSLNVMLGYLCVQN